MAQRYARVDVDFLHKNTAHRLRQKLGRDAQLVFLALILRAKDGAPPGTFSYSSEAVGWEKLGFDGEDMPFTLDEFFRVTGAMHQTSRRRNNAVWTTTLTRYGDWQKDSRRYEDAEKKRRKRAQTTGDKQGTQQGTAEGRKRGPRSRTRSTPIPPSDMNGKHPNECPHCGARQRTRPELEDHIRYVHYDEATT